MNEMAGKDQWGWGGGGGRGRRGEGGTFFVVTSYGCNSLVLRSQKSTPLIGSCDICATSPIALVVQ
jgi:hypothetical protein